MNKNELSQTKLKLPQHNRIYSPPEEKIEAASAKFSGTRKKRTQTRPTKTKGYMKPKRNKQMKTIKNEKQEKRNVSSREQKRAHNRLYRAKKSTPPEERKMSAVTRKRLARKNKMKTKNDEVKKPNGGGIRKS